MRDFEHHEQLYSGFAQKHFAKSAMVEFRQHHIRRILRLTGAGANSRVLSLGSGIGDVELLLARHVGHVLGVEISPRGVEQARSSAAGQGVGNAEFAAGAFEQMALPPASFDVVVAVFFLHHVVSRLNLGIPESVWRVLKPGGVFYSLDPSHYRLTGFLGRRLVPSLMKKHQTEDEAELKPSEARRAFARMGFTVAQHYYDFASIPMAGLFPSWRTGYLVSRRADDVLTRIPGLNLLSSDFELVAQKPL
jgi:ubiquinone/menaquinone biosynthesis C-methylase UbiE